MFALLHEKKTVEDAISGKNPMKASKLFRKYPKTTSFDHPNYQLLERIPAVPGTSNNQGLTVI